MTKIGVVGLGLIGGSIFKDLNEHGYDVVGISQSQSDIKNVYSDYSYLKDCNLVFVCKEMGKTLETLDILNIYLNKDVIVADVCSLKEFVSVNKYNYKFIPSHPMAGTEFSGWNSAQKNLFKGAKWVITPIEKDYKPTILEDVIQKLGAEIVYTTPKEHDEAVALISHMPMVIAQALYKTAETNSLAMKLASSGFRDMTRLALSSIDMANDMVDMNALNIEKAILKLYENVGFLTKNDYRTTITAIKESRNNMYKDGKNIL
ncbi:MAG: prephenate dehydrogenase/arogenate dehydrogenase family protein [Candidatus Gastranaerophilales bacterium]|nr:prephenate dehydrogenase/arogenate dehydrogenase family protein [Candidatus Gastranaerophilales bacterium]